MLIASNSHVRALKALCVASVHVGVYLAIPVNSAIAQTPPKPPQPVPPPSTVPGQVPQQLPPSPPAGIPTEVPAQQQPPAPPSAIDILAPSVNNEGMSSQLTRYILGPGDVLGVVIQRPPGRYRLGPGDVIAVAVQRFPDLSFQAQVNPEGNIVVPLLGTVSLQNLTLQQAQAKVRAGLNQYVVEPIVTLSLVALRPELSYQAQVNPEGNIVLPQLGSLSVQGLTLQEAQEKIRLGFSRILVEPVVAVSLAAARPVQISISGEVARPGIYPVQSGTPRVADALLIAGGSSMMADLRGVQVRRRLVDGSIASQTIDLYTPLQTGGAFPNLRLQDGDAIIIPRREIGADDGYDRNLVARSTLAQQQIRIRVLNYAANGILTVALPNGSTFIDALSGTGVNPDTVNLREIALIRFDPERGKAVTQRLDAKKALSGDASQNVPLQDNDVIVVGRNLIGRITNALSTVTRPFFDVRSFLGFFDFIFGGNQR